VSWVPGWGKISLTHPPNFWLGPVRRAGVRAGLASVAGPSVVVNCHCNLLNVVRGLIGSGSRAAGPFFCCRSCRGALCGALHLKDTRGFFLVLATEAAFHKRDTVLDGYLWDSSANHASH
jgi:hypothetical protein